MKRRTFLQSSAAAGASASLLGAMPQDSSRKPKEWNILVVVSDTMRTAFMGPYGSKTTRTPNFDRFAGQSAVFDRAHPESLPTIPMRRTLHSGRRGYPFRNYQPVPWDNVYIVGWQPMDREEDTVAEALDRAGYHCGFIADVPHYFVPGMNYTRGFRQWDFVRGNAEDRYRSTAPYSEAELKKRFVRGSLPHVANLGGWEPDEMDFATPRTFSSAIKFLDENRQGEKPFYLFVDTFHPHETWVAPRKYYEMYADPNYQGKTWQGLPYSTLFDHPIPEADLQDVRANYSGLVTMVDHWFGRLMDKLDEIGASGNTLVFFASDHGTNFGDNIEKAIGKPAGALYPGTMDAPLIIRHPQGTAAGRRFNELVYTFDIPATICAVTGAAPQDGVHGKNLLPLLEGGDFEQRDCLVCRYSNSVWYRDDRNWYFSTINWTNPRLFDLEATRPFAKTIALQAPERLKLARNRILEEAAGKLPEYPLKGTDKVKAPFISEQG